ncbi:hypothetical protein [Streptomyces sp. NPDC002172]
MNAAPMIPFTPSMATYMATAVAPLKRKRNQSVPRRARNALIFGFFAMRDPVRSETPMPT